MPKEELNSRSNKPAPYPVRSSSSRRQSVRYAENFDQLVESFQSVINMGGGLENNSAPTDSPVNSVSNQGLVDNLNNDQAEAENLANSIAELRLKREKPKQRLVAFSNVSVVSRRMLNEIGVIVSLYRELKDIEQRISQKFSEWLIVCGKTEDELENENCPLKPSLIDKEIDDIGILVDKVESTVKQQYPEKQEVIDYLDFIDAVPKQRSSSHGSSVRSNSSESAALGKGKEYLQTKIPILKKEVQSRYDSLKQNFDSNIYTTEASLHDAAKKLEALEGKITEDSTFEKLLRELFEFSNEEFEQHEKWRQDQLALISVLSSSIEKLIDEKRVAKDSEKKSVSSSGFSTFFKKQDPPKFKGDCLDYLEFKKKSISQVSSHSPPAEFEIDLLKRNLPEEGKKKLYEVETMNTAWRLLDNLYGD